MRYLIQHQTQLDFFHQAQDHHCELRLSPRQDIRQKLISFDLKIEPQAKLFLYTDYWGNQVHSFNLAAPHLHLSTYLTSEVETFSQPFPSSISSPGLEQEDLSRILKSTPILWDYIVHQSEKTPDLKSFNSDLSFPVYNPKKNLFEQVQEAMGWIASILTYCPGSTEVHAPLVEVLRTRAGVCQDFSHLLISLIRSWGFPSRYVMGYQEFQDSELSPAATHAWVEIFLPEMGWYGVDPTHQLVIDESYIAIAQGRDSSDAAPQRGIFKGKDQGRKPKVFLQVIHQ